MGSEHDELVLDASAFYAGVPFGTSSGTTYVTTPGVYDEVSHIKSRHDALGVMSATGRLSVAEPTKESVDAARSAARATGDAPKLSGQDLSVIALSMQTGFGLVTDDFAVSNVARSMGIGVTPVMTGGISRVVCWQYYCPGCDSISDTGEDVIGNPDASAGGAGGAAPAGAAECRTCGSILRKRRKKAGGGPST